MPQVGKSNVEILIIMLQQGRYRPISGNCNLDLCSMVPLAGGNHTIESHSGTRWDIKGPVVASLLPTLNPTGRREDHHDGRNNIFRHGVRSFSIRKASAVNNTCAQKSRESISIMTSSAIDYARHSQRFIAVCKTLLYNHVP